MSSIRKHYITICLRGNTVITYRVINDNIEITFEQAKNGGFNTMVTDINGKIISNDGFNGSDVGYLLSFLEQNKNCITRLATDDT